MHLLPRPFLFVGILLLSGKTNAMPINPDGLVAGSSSASDHCGRRGWTLDKPSSAFPLPESGIQCRSYYHSTSTLDHMELDDRLAKSKGDNPVDHDDRMAHTIKTLLSTEIWSQLPHKDSHISSLDPDYYFSQLRCHKQEAWIVIGVNPAGKASFAIQLNERSLDSGSVFVSVEPRPEEFFRFAEGKYWVHGWEEFKMPLPSIDKNDVKTSRNDKGEYTLYVELPCQLEGKEAGQEDRCHTKLHIL
ncbi:hypothetical protein EV360DRAFT_83430 [Lentinula raphanica]|nr:hypothetical protein EV360DRAFT_83430 [Lentinula raphanica]